MRPSYKGHVLNVNQAEALEEFMDSMQGIRDEIEEFGDNVDLTDTMDTFAGYAEELFLSFSRKRKKYFS